MDAPPSKATAPGPRRKSTRVRRPNVTLDLEGVYLERLCSKKDARSGFASYVSARVREITDLLSDKRNLQAVKEKLAHAIRLLIISKTLITNIGSKLERNVTSIWRNTWMISASSADG